jgi:hypothetical protein
MSRGLTRSLVLLVALAAVALANIPNSIVLTQYGPVQGYGLFCDHSRLQNTIFRHRTLTL